jgi:hypothetical protein
VVHAADPRGYDSRAGGISRAPRARRGSGQACELPGSQWSLAERIRSCLRCAMTSASLDRVRGEHYGARTNKARGLSDKTQNLRDTILAVFAETDKPVTVRQMFYMLTVRGAVSKTEAQGYRPVQRQLVAMRREGLIPYHWIADNTRWIRKPTTYDSLGDFLNLAARQYRQTIWTQAGTHVEVWVEKDALAGAIYPITAQYDVPLMVARGYSSESFAHEAAEYIAARGRRAFVYYLGDFDPSGWDMCEGLKDKLYGFGADMHFERLAVNSAQVGAWNLPERPSKLSDTRCKRFFQRFGQGCPSVELDAIPPDRLRALVSGAIESHLSPELVEAVTREEQLAKTHLSDLAARWKDA